MGQVRMLFESFPVGGIAAFCKIFDTVLCFLPGIVWIVLVALSIVDKGDFWNLPFKRVTADRDRDNLQGFSCPSFTMLYSATSHSITTTPIMATQTNHQSSSSPKWSIR